MSEFFLSNNLRKSNSRYRIRWNKIKELFGKFKDLGVIGIGNVTASGISGIFWFYLASILGAEKYGEVSYFIAIAGIATTISYLGLGNTIIIYSAKGEKIQTPAFLIGIISSIVTLLAVYGIFTHIGVSLYILGYVIFNLVTAELLGRRIYKSYTKYLISQKILMVVFTLGLYYAIGLEGVILGIALSFLPYVVRVIKSFKENQLDLKLIRKRLGFTMNSYALDLSRTFSGYTDKLIIAPIFGFAILGNYQLGIQFLAVLTILPGIVYQYLLPQDARGESNKKLKQLTVLVSIILALAGITLSPIVLPVLFPKFTEAVQVIQIVSISVIPSTINLIYISKFLGKELSRVVLIGSGIFLAIQISLIFVLGEIWGVNGVAAALVIGASSETIFLAIMKKKFFE